jgi:hypothetical protein
MWIPGFDGMAMNQETCNGPIVSIITELGYK